MSWDDDPDLDRDDLDDDDADDADHEAARGAPLSQDDGGKKSQATILMALAERTGAQVLP